MATSTSFKQECPICEALVPIRDPKLVGKKIKCPKCEGTFLVKAPPEDKDENEEGVTSSPSKKSKTAGNGKVTDKKPAKAGAKKGKGDEDGTDVKKKKKGGSNTLLVGGGLAFVAIAALGVGAYSLFSGGSPPKPKKGPVAQGPGVPTPTDPGKTDDKKDLTKTGASKEEKSDLPDPTNLLPADATGVFSINVENLKASGVWRSAIHPSGPFSDASFERVFGFPFGGQGVARIVTATNRKGDWVFSVLRTAQKINQEELKVKLKLKEQEVNGARYYLILRQFDSIGNLLLKANRPRDTFAVHVADNQTLIFADVEPLKKFLQDRPKPQEKPAGTTATGKKEPPPSLATYKTIGSDLKDLVDRVDHGDSPALICMVGDVDWIWTVVRPLVSGAVKHGAQQLMPLIAKTPSLPFAIQDFDKTVKAAGANPEPVVMATERIVLDEGKTAAVALTSLTQDKLGLAVALETKGEQTATLWLPLLKQVLDFWTAATTGSAVPTPTPTNPGTGQPPPAATAPIVVAASGKVLSFNVVLTLSPKEYDLYTTDLRKALVQAKGDADLANTAPRYHQLAKALTEYVKKTGHFPRGTAPRKDALDGGSDYRRPDARVSWMASLLPFLPESSFGNLNVDPNKEWYRDENLAAAQLVVSQFVVRSKDTAFKTTYPTLHGEYGVTHFVGMAGLGADAANYRAGDKTVEDKIGIFGYDRDTTPDAMKGHLDKVIALIQVPPDYRAPWMAGGGATVRGVSADEKGCVQPFVACEYKGKRGTFAIMADGKVRFIRADIDAALFRAMCTLKGPDKVDNFNTLVPEVPDEDVAVQVIAGAADKPGSEKPAEKPMTEKPDSTKPMPETPKPVTPKPLDKPGPTVPSGPSKLAPVKIKMG